MCDECRKRNTHAIEFCVNQLKALADAVTSDDYSEVAELVPVMQEALDESHEAASDLALRLIAAYAARIISLRSAAEGLPYLVLTRIALAEKGAIEEVAKERRIEEAMNRLGMGDN